MYSRLEIRNLLAAIDPEGISDAGMFRCRSVPGRGDCFVGQDGEGSLVALFPACSNDREISINDVFLNTRKEVQWFDNGVSSDVKTVLRFRRMTTDDADAFAGVVSSVLNTTSEHSDPENYLDVIDSWFTLLGGARVPTFAEILGFWGELFAIKLADTSLAVESWQWRDRDPADFTFRGEQLEIKTTLFPVRQHSTSKDQDSNLRTIPTWLLSVLTREESSGVSIEDLVFDCLSRLSDDLARAKVMSACARRIGFGREFRDVRFEIEEAITLVRLFSWSDVPCPIWPSGVVDARWSFVLGDSAGLSLSQFGSTNLNIGQLFRGEANGMGQSLSLEVP